MRLCARPLPSQGSGLRYTEGAAVGMSSTVGGGSRPLWWPEESEGVRSFWVVRLLLPVIHLETQLSFDGVHEKRYGRSDEVTDSQKRW